jgi:hypothetical protein
MPKIFSLTQEAQDASEVGVAANVLAGITMSGAEQMAKKGIEQYPAKLDFNPNNLCGNCFSEVVKDPVASKQWNKVSDSTYVYLPNSSTYKYDSTLGTFAK